MATLSSKQLYSEPSGEEGRAGLIFESWEMLTGLIGLVVGGEAVAVAVVVAVAVLPTSGRD